VRAAVAVVSVPRVKSDPECFSAAPDSSDNRHMDRIYASLALAILAGVFWIGFLADCSEARFALGALVGVIGSVVFLAGWKPPSERVA